MIRFKSIRRPSARNSIAILGLLAASVLALSGSPAFAGNTTYKYDSLGRVIEVDYPNGTVIKYTYDAAGNRTQVAKTAGS